jgi:hypothetical protein
VVDLGYDSRACRHFVNCAFTAFAEHTSQLDWALLAQDDGGAHGSMQTSARDGGVFTRLAINKVMSSSVR